MECISSQFSRVYVTNAFTDILGIIFITAYFYFCLICESSRVRVQVRNFCAGPGSGLRVKVSGSGPGSAMDPEVRTFAEH